MRAVISARLLSSKAAQPGVKPFEIPDTRLPGFLLRVQPSGHCSYYAQLGRGRRAVIGKVGVLTPDEARERCAKMLGNVAHGRPPFHGIEGASTPTLDEFVRDTYGPWLLANRPKSAKKRLQRIKTVFKKWGPAPLDALSLPAIEKWMLGRYADELSPSTISSDLLTLSGLLAQAVRHGKLPENVIDRVAKPRIDRTPKVRYLSSQEHARLRAALIARDERVRAERDSANEWRRERKRPLYPRLDGYADALHPAVVVSLNTGLRRGELLALTWTNVNLAAARLTVEGDTAKSGQTRHLPLNAEAVAALKLWKEQSQGERVFPVATGFKTSWTRLLAAARIHQFRWHDMRHDFASRLVSKGVPLNTVRELLGHGSLGMTVRYAHLAPDQKADAVALLVRP